MYHLRANSRLPPKLMMKRLPLPPSPRQHVMRPVPSMHRYAVKQYPHQLTASSYQRPTISTPQRIRFNSSPPGPNTGEYIFENPFTMNNVRPPQNKYQVSITGDNKYSAIHTIAAPNLAIHSGYDQYLQPLDNHINGKEYQEYQQENQQLNRNVSSFGRNFISRF